MKEDNKIEQSDLLDKIVNLDLPSDKSRIQKMDANVENLKTEIHGTVIPYIQDLSSYLLMVRNYVQESMVYVDEKISELSEEIDEIRNPLETSFLPEDAEKFIKIISACRWMSEELLKVPGIDEAGKSKLNDIIELADECEMIVSENVLSLGDDEEEFEEGSEEEKEKEQN